MTQHEMRKLADQLGNMPLPDVLYFLMYVSYHASKKAAPDSVTKTLDTCYQLIQKAEFTLSTEKR